MALLDHLILNENAYFYKAEDGFNLSKNKIDNIFAEVSSDRIGNYTLKKVKQAEALGTFSVYYSICVFKFEKRPSFLDEDVPGIYETKYAYLLIVEYAQFIVVIRKNISNLKLLNESIEPLDYITISRVYVNNDTRFEKLSMKNMDIANTAIRNKVIEANDVKDSISNLGANKYIIQNMRIADNEGTKSVSLNTSRISDVDKKVPLRELLNWIVGVVNKTRAFAGVESFLDVFATPVDFESNISQIIPTSILFSVSELKNEIETEKIIGAKIEHNGIQRSIPLVNLLKYIDAFKNYCELEKNEDEDNLHNIINESDKSLRIRVNAKSITVNSKKLNKITLEFSNKEIDIVQYINQHHSYLITFDRIELIYFSRKLFKDNKLLTSASSFFSAFIPNPELQNTTSEKGEVNPVSTNFEAQSIFSIIESNICNDSSFLFCDDLGNEWADYISLEDDSINFYHAKSNNGGGHGLSASEFQIIVGQALKNLGNVIPSGNQWGSKITKWDEMYSGSQIRRLRRGTSVNNGIEFYKQLVNKPNIRKRIHLVVDFISKTQLVDQLTRLLNNEQVQRRNELVQILWFISSLISTCTELGYEVYIICQP